MSSPVVGFGIDAQYTARYPHGLQNLCLRYHDRLTHLSVVSLRNVRQAEWFKRECAKGLPIIHHLSNVAPADVDGPHLNRLQLLDDISRELKAIWSCEDIGIWSLGPYGIPYFAPPVFEAEVADNVAEGVRSVLERSSVDFLAEIPSCSFVIGKMTLGNFFHRLVERAKCRLVLDVGHVYSYALFRGEEPNRVLQSLPLTAVRELHVAGAKISPRYEYRYIDTHCDPILKEVEELLLLAVETCPELRCITFELGFSISADLIESELDRLEKTLNRVAWAPKLQVPQAA
jgi:uncharacterized protein